MASKLEELAKQFRIENTKGNTYQNTESGKYSASHPNAKSDGDNKGKGTGVELGTENGGSVTDIKGNPDFPGSGRDAALSKNNATYGYGKGNEYTHPDTGDNEGQFTLGG
jgi:hypothetical protein